MAEPTPPPAPSPAARPPLLSLDEALARLLGGAAAHRIARTETVGSFDALGRVLADLVTGRGAAHDLHRFRLARFSDGSRLTPGPAL